MIRVAITGVSGDAGLGAVCGLLAGRDAGDKLWLLGLDMNADCPARWMVDAYEQLPPVSDAGYIEALGASLRDNAIDVLLPAIDSEIRILSNNRARLATFGARLALAPPDLVDAADDKLMTFAFLAKRGVAVPETHALGDPADLGFPVVAKPRRGQGSRGVYVIPDAASLTMFLREGPQDYCLQRHIDGPEVTVGFLYDWNGRLCDAIAMERTLAGGRTVRASVLTSPDILRFMEDFGCSVKGAGAVNAQLRIDPIHGPQVFEINARLSGSTGMRVVVGFNDPLRIVKHLAEGTPMMRATVREATVLQTERGPEVQA